MRAVSRFGAVLVLFGLLVGCSAGSSAEAPSPVALTAPPGPPADWAWIASDDDALWLSLPPWLGVFDTQGAIFANEIGAGEGLQLMAEGLAEQQPSPGGIERWLAERVASNGAGHPTVELVDVPAGPAVRLHRLDRAGTPLAREVEAWAIGTPRGVAFLMVDGPPDAWLTHHEDVRRIVLLLRVVPPETTNGSASRGTNP